MIFYALLISLAISASIVSANDGILFSETFDTDPFTSKRWALSKQSKYIGQPVKVLASGENLPGLENDLGVQLTQEMKHYGFGSQFKEPIRTEKGKDLIIQYEVKFIDTFNCGGAYVKLLRGDENANVERLDSETPYTIMFGPDKCGSTNKVHFILQYQNPVTKKWEEKHFNETIPIKSDKNTHLYSLVLHPDDSFDVLVDNKKARAGTLLTHLHPPINPPEFIDDPEDHKPADWVDLAEIDDPNASKPDDWDESQPKKIPDATATKPEEWVDDAPETIPNPEIEKPEDWDDEEDGEWEAPSIPNPACSVGCGEWKPPLIDNPLFRGKWRAPKIPNPEYKGVWKAKQIKNPEYFEDNHPFANIAPMTALAVEVWTTNAGVHFDNFVIGTSRDAVTSFTGKTWKVKHDAELAAAKKESKASLEKERSRVYAEGTFTEKVKFFVVDVSEYFKENPTSLAITILAIVVPLMYILLFGGKNPSVDVNGNKIEKKEDDPDATKNSSDKTNEAKTTDEKEE